MDRALTWNSQSHPIRLGVDVRGSGPVVLMLPALSSISTRDEMRPLAEELSAEFRTVAVDWPGFGDLPLPAIAWQPAAYRSYLEFLLKEFPDPLATIAAGHGAGFLLQYAAANPSSAGRLCLIAPTWRGPLPTMMGRRHPAFRIVSRLVDLPVLGAALYRLNVNRPMIRMMSLGHVYADRSWLSPERFASKLTVTEAPGARHASFRFVAGELDPMSTRDEFLDAARRITDPMLMIYGADTPPRSKAEMKELAALRGVVPRELPKGRLAVHEEFPGEVADAIRKFLARTDL